MNRSNQPTVIVAMVASDLTLAFAVGFYFAGFSGILAVLGFLGIGILLACMLAMSGIV